MTRGAVIVIEVAGETGEGAREAEIGIIVERVWTKIQTGRFIDE